MYRTRKLFAFVSINILLFVCVIFTTFTFIPIITENSPYSPLFAFVTAAFIFFVFSLMMNGLKNKWNDINKRRSLYSGETGILTEFANKLRFCYSLDDFYDSIANILEVKGDCTVLFVDRKKKYVLYNSPDRLSCMKETMDTLDLNFSNFWDDGIYYLGENLGIVSRVSKSRGFFFSFKQKHLYVFCRYTRLFEHVAFKTLFDEFSRFISRAETIANLSEIASLSKEWKQLADTQKSFLPPVMPKIDKLQLAAYFRPLVNVSGDYYTVLPITPTKTLLMLGDVSGKGLAAALVMGLVMNTVKILEDKEDLAGMIRAVHKAIKGMKLQDKYTVVFIGVVDTEKMVINYVNASMSDPLIITNSPSGYRIRPLESNCSLVGIIDIDEVEVAEQKLFRDDVILMASDGVSEVMNDEGVELGDTDLYDNTIKSSAHKTPKEFIDDVVNLIMEYNGGKKLRDDVTMLVAKVGR